MVTCTQLMHSSAPHTNATHTLQQTRVAVLFYHFVTGSNGVKQVFSLGQLKPGMKLDTMYMSQGLVRKPYQVRLAVLGQHAT